MAAATYVYCVVRSTRAPSLSRVPAGLPGGQPPEVHAVAADIWLVSSAVPLDRFGAGPLEQSLKDLEWVSAIAVAHEDVVEHFARPRGVTVIPMKLFTLFSDANRAVAEMRRRRRSLAAVFAKLQGCEEWGVRIMRRARPARPARPGKPAGGAAFLAARKQAREAAVDAARESVAAADDAYAVLAKVASDHRRRDGERPGVTPPLLDAAFLVPVRRRARVQAIAEQAARNVTQGGGELTLTGPWPAYNFVSIPEEPA